MKSTIRQTTLAALVGLSLSAYAAPFQDDFSARAPVVTASGASGSKSGAWVALGGGASRQISTTIGSNSLPKSATARSRVDGAYEIKNDPGVDAYGDLVYAFSNHDFRGVSSVRVDFLASTGGFLLLTLGDASTSAVMGFQGLEASAAPYSVTFDIPESAGTDLDMRHVTDMRFFIAPGEGGFARISKVQAVPEPGSFAALALGGLALSRRRSARR